MSGRSESISEYRAGLSPELREIFDGLCAAIADAAPGLAGAIKWHIPTYGGRRPALGIQEGPGYMRVEFFDGYRLADPDALLEGNGPRVRHVKVRSVADAEDARLRLLIAAAGADG